MEGGTKDSGGREILGQTKIARNAPSRIQSTLKDPNEVFDKTNTPANQSMKKPSEEEIEFNVQNQTGLMEKLKVDSS